MLNNPWNHPALLVTVCLMTPALTVAEAHLKQNDWGRPKVNVVHKEQKWVIEGRKNCVSLNPSSRSCRG